VYFQGTVGAQRFFFVSVIRTIKYLLDIPQLLAWSSEEGDRFGTITEE
jgi:hypothetical protein